MIPTILNNWPHKWYGFFATATHPWEINGSSITLDDVMGMEWDPETKRKTLAYMKASPIVICGSIPDVPCEICGLGLSASEFQSDGVWLWPVALSHDVEIHDVGLLGSMLQHFREANFIPPPECGKSLDQLPWPNLD